MADSICSQCLRRSVLILICMSVLTSVHGLPKHGIDYNVCNPKSIINSASPKLPSLPSKYQLTVEANLEDKNYTTDFTEYYDQINNRAAVHQWEFGFHISSIFSYNTNQLITIEDQTGTCAVDKLSTDSDNFLFGYQPSSTNPHVGKMFSAYGALRFGGNYSEQYMGVAKVRGIQCDHWQSCMYWPSKDATMWVDTYFSRPDWTASVSPRTPVRCSVHGNVWESDKGQLAPRAFNHTYEFSEFRTDLPPPSDVFETPPGVLCINRTDSKPVPIPPNHFRFSAEVLDPVGKTIGFAEEWFNHDAGLVRFDHKPEPNALSPFGTDFLSEVHDFTEGISYIKDPARGNCTPTPISTVGFDTKDVTSNIVRIRTAKEFFYFDKTNYQYTGVKKMRSIDCDVWIGLRQDWPPFSPVNSTWEWYFATDIWQQSTGHIYEFGMPIQLTINADQLGKLIYNIYDYDEEQPKVFDFDITPCFNYTEQRDFSFKIDAVYKDTVAKNVEIFKYMVLLEVHKWSGVSPLRITNIKVDYDATHVIVTFTLLGVAPIKGDVAQAAKQVDLYSATTVLQDAINKGDFVINIDVDKLTDTLSFKASPYTPQTGNHSTVDYTPEYYLPPQTQKTTYTAGQLAGLGLGMLVLFFIIGFAGVFLFFRSRNGGASNSAQSSNEKSIDNPVYEN